MTVAPQSHAEILQVETGDDQGRRIAHLQDKWESTERPAHGLTAVYFTARAAGAARDPEARLPLLTFATHEGKSLQVLLDLPTDKAAEFLGELRALISEYAARRGAFVRRLTVNPI
jgi:hypothetical protein